MFLRTCNKKLKVFSFLYHVNISILFCSFFIKSHSALPIPRRADKDPKTCEILVDNVESKDLGAWRSNFFREDFTIDSVAWKLSRCLVRRKCPHWGSWRRRKCAELRAKSSEFRARWRKTITVRETPGIFHTDHARSN